MNTPSTIQNLISLLKIRDFGTGKCLHQQKERRGREATPNKKVKIWGFAQKFHFYMSRCMQRLY